MALHCQRALPAWRKTESSPPLVGSAITEMKVHDLQNLREKESQDTVTRDTFLSS